MSDPFVIPQLINPYALSVDDCWAERKTTGIHLLKNWGTLTFDKCCTWQHDSFDYASTNDLTSMEWALMMNSCDGLLVERIDKKFEDLDLYREGGITYIKIALDEMFTISNTNTVVTTLQGFFEASSKDGIRKVPNKDARIVMEQIVAIAE